MFPVSVFPYYFVGQFLLFISDIVYYFYLIYHILDSINAASIVIF